MPPPTGSEQAPGRARLLSVATIVKPHGLRGDVVVALVSNRPERMEPGSELYDAEGRAYRIVRARGHKGRHIVSFEGITSIEEAEQRRGTELLAPPISDPDVLWVHELVGSRVEDTEGTVLGSVIEVQANPASDLLVTDRGALIPLRFVVATTPGERVVVRVPDGLLDES